MSKITFIVAIYNVEDYIERCLDSLKKQTVNDFEVFMVNDGSKDHTREILEKYAKEDKRFILFDKENGGLSDARNFGLKHVQSPYVSFIDGDDYVEADLLEKTMPLMEKEDLDMLVFGYNQVYLEDGHVEENHLRMKDGIYNLKDNKELLAYTPNAAWNKIYKVSLFKDNQIEYPFGYRHQDMGTTPKLLLKANKVGILNDCLYNYIVDRPNNITAQIDKKLYHIADMAKEVVDYYKTNGVFDEYINELNYLILRNFIQSLRKAVSMKDRSFVFGFIDTLFALKSEWFFKAEDIYTLKETGSDSVYLSSSLCKLYYLYRHIGD